MSEAKVQNKIIKYLEKNGYIVTKVGIANKRAVLDLIVCTPEGLYAEIEVKYGNNKPSPLQQLRIKEIKNNNAMAGAAWSLEDALEILK